MSQTAVCETSLILKEEVSLCARKTLVIQEAETEIRVLNSFIHSHPKDEQF